MWIMTLSISSMHACICVLSLFRSPSPSLPFSLSRSCSCSRSLSLPPTRPARLPPSLPPSHPLSPSLAHTHNVQVLVVSHGSTLKALYSYFSGIEIKDCHTQEFPLHTVIELTPGELGRRFPLDLKRVLALTNLIRQ